MATTHVRFLPVLLATALLGACGERLDVEVKATIDGQPAAQAKVTVDREELGVTDARGLFTQRLRKKAGTEVEVTVSKEAPGYRIDPWKSSFLVKLPKGDQIVTYRVEADLKATRYVTVRVSEGGTPVPEAKVTVGGKEEGVTDAKGEFVYSYRTQPAKGAEIGVAKSGFSAYRATRQLEPGQVVVIALAAPGYVPSTWKATVKLEGHVNLQRYFYPTAPRPIRIGVYRVVGNTPGVDLKEVAAQAEQALATQLFKFPAFREVPGERLQAEVNQRKLSIARITTKGWQDTPLRASVDMIVLGSVAKDDGGYLVEVKFHTANGKIIFSEIARARSAGGINGAVRDIASNVIERFPLEGTVVGKEDDRYRIHIGRK